MIASTGNPELPALLRSCAKPFQLITVLASGAAERFSLSDEELAVAAASHSAEVEHLHAVKSMLLKLELDKSVLRCGTHPPFVPHVVARMAREGISVEPIHHNCSGKHTSMLAACLTKEWNLADYEEPDHPLQLENHARMALFADLDISDVGVAVDGCTVPTFRLPMHAAALAYARIADHDMAPEGEQEYARRVFEIMNGHPSLGSGKKGRLEAALMKAFPGTLIAKVGAEGFFAVGIAPGVIDEYGVGVVVKMEDGITFNRGCDPVVVAALHQLGVIKEMHMEQLAEFAPAQVLNNRGLPVGSVEILFDLRKQA
jgi:L-asparaginase II